MARKPNYNFERAQREKAKAEKKAARLQAKADKAEARKAAENGDEAGTAAETETRDDT